MSIMRIANCPAGRQYLRQYLKDLKDAERPNRRPLSSGMHFRAIVSHIIRKRIRSLRGPN